MTVKLQELTELYTSADPYLPLKENVLKFLLLCSSQKGRNGNNTIFGSKNLFGT